MTMASTWSSLSTWFTPTILFCFLNLMIAIIFLTSRKRQSEHPQLGADSHQLVRAPSLLQRVKSINFSFNRSDHYTSSPVEVEVEEASQSHHVEEESERHEVTRSKSETIIPAPVKIMKKSMSEKQLAASAAEDLDVGRRPATVREGKGKGKGVNLTRGRVSGEDEGEGVDDKADDFINRFRQQLKLQRMDSILRYTEMLKRGAGR